MTVALPIGISFFTFQSLSYTIDVYRKVHAPLRHLHDYLLYILMFPQLIAGPIVRFNTIADDIEDRQHNDTIDNKLYGVYRFALGLAKKVLIANILGAQVDQFYALPHEQVTGTIARIAALAYSFQIYFDFSGYSDMAIGLGYLLGFKFPENFNNPYTSQSVSEFWRRWHITLGAWFKDYLYIPLGGNRAGKVRQYINLGIVFVVCGIWHGAGWNFLIWGIWHAPIIAVGHNYAKVAGTDPWWMIAAAIVAMCVVCVVLSILFNYIAEKADSVWPAVIAHGCVNGCAGLGILFLTSPDVANPFVGPTPVGIVGGVFFVLAALWIAVRKSRSAAPTA